MPEGRESPPPEMQSGKQQHDAPGSGQGIDNTGKKGEQVKKEVENLSSNPKGAMDDTLKDKFSKQ